VPRGPEPTPPSATPDPKAQYNFTDPESGIIKEVMERLVAGEQGAAP
jgi:hypothetical protein